MSSMLLLIVFTVVLQNLSATGQNIQTPQGYYYTYTSQAQPSLDQTSAPLPQWYIDLLTRKAAGQSNVHGPTYQLSTEYGTEANSGIGLTNSYLGYQDGKNITAPTPAATPDPTYHQSTDYGTAATGPADSFLGYQQKQIPAPTYPLINDYEGNRPLPNWFIELQNRKPIAMRGNTPLPNPPTSDDPNDTCPRDVIHDRHHGKGYFFSWDDKRTKYLNLTWAAALQFCKARCLELVSVETKDEDTFLAKHIRKGRQTDVWTSGRKCDFRGCESNPNLQPIEIYGWFWEGSRTQLPPTTDLFDVNWSDTGALGKPQPDNLSGVRGGENESCLAIRNNAYNDGIRWHDEVCSKRKPFICEERSRIIHQNEHYMTNQ